MSENIVEVRGDGGDFAEIWVNGARILELCSDDDDLTTASTVAKNIATALAATFSESNDYEWVPGHGMMTEDEANAYYDAQEGTEAQE